MNDDEIIEFMEELGKRFALAVIANAERSPGGYGALVLAAMGLSGGIAARAEDASPDLAEEWA